MNNDIAQKTESLQDGLNDRLNEELRSGLQEEEQDRFLTFPLGENLFGIGIGKVLEIIRHQKITPVPGVQSHVLGAINLRGKVLMVMDARRRMEMPIGELNDRSCILVVDHKGQQVGMLVDTVDEVRRIPPSLCEPPPAIRKSPIARFLSGLGRMADKTILLIDLERLVQDQSA